MTKKLLKRDQTHDFQLYMSSQFKTLQKIEESIQTHKVLTMAKSAFIKVLHLVMVRIVNNNILTAATTTVTVTYITRKLCFSLGYVWSIQHIRDLQSDILTHIDIL